ncbi:hypothetical protein DRP04_07810 [Archaeoglobales archaeon]|nr:MAG: hypothetical protein DRP04_07810 [Archaeoglobales archaeon]
MKRATVCSLAGMTLGVGIGLVASMFGGKILLNLLSLIILGAVFGNAVSTCSEKTKRVFLGGIGGASPALAMIVIAPFHPTIHDGNFLFWNWIASIGGGAGGAIFALRGKSIWSGEDSGPKPKWREYYDTCVDGGTAGGIVGFAIVSAGTGYADHIFLAPFIGGPFGYITAAISGLILSVIIDDGVSGTFGGALIGIIIAVVIVCARITISLLTVPAFALVGYFAGKLLGDRLDRKKERCEELKAKVLETIAEIIGNEFDRKADQNSKS